MRGRLAAPRDLGLLGVNINVVTTVDDSGYGVVGFNILKALDALGHNVVYFARHSGPVADFERDLSEVAFIVRCGRRQPDMDMTAPCIRITYEGDMTLFAGHGPHCGLSFFETTRFTERELHHLGHLDRLFVASGWAQRIAIDNGLDPNAVVVTPMGVSRSIFYDTPMPTRRTTVFSCVGKWERRKGQDALVDAFSRAFRPGDDVELRMLCHNPWSPVAQERWIDICRDSPMATHITILPRARDQHEVADVLRDTDCCVFPSRAEGWNLEALETLSCGRYVIATDYSAHTEYLDSDNALLVDIDELEPASDPLWQPIYSDRKIGDWAHLGENQIDQLAHHLRTVHEMKQRDELDVNRAGIATASRFTWERTACEIVGALEQIPSSAPSA